MHMRGHFFTMAALHKNTFYAVGIGKQTGVFQLWSEVEPLIKGVSNAKFQKFASFSAAKEFVDCYANVKVIAKTPPKVVTKRSKKVTPEETIASSNCSIDSEIMELQSLRRAARQEKQRKKRDLAHNKSDEDIFDPDHSLLEACVTSSQSIFLSDEEIGETHNNKEGNIAAVAKRISAIENRLTKLEQHSAETSQIISSLRNAVTTLNSRIARDTVPMVLHNSSTTAKKAKLVDDTASQIYQDSTTELRWDPEGYCMVYTDGSCCSNGTIGATAGIGVWFSDNHPMNISEPLHDCVPTNNNAEIQAATRALESLASVGVNRVKLHTDSQFVIQCVTEWMDKWKQNKWRKTDNKPVTNKEQLLLLDAACKNMSIKWVHVRGHSNILGNEMADKLANEGSQKYKLLHNVI